jgi:hypothetical protein
LTDSRRQLAVKVLDAPAYLLDHALKAGDRCEKGVVVEFHRTTVRSGPDETGGHPGHPPNVR